MNGNNILKVDSISKKFSRTLRQSMLYGLTDIGRSILRINPKSPELRKNEFWAVKDVSFEVKKGETVGIIGSNGSGKTTLLRLLAGIYPPDKGLIELKGDAVPFIDARAGFHPLLTGRENIYINSAILGMGKKEIEKKFDSIVQFAEIGDFLDTPVKFYSKGMAVRLGFSVMVHREPEILLIDEVLHVGDAYFRKKSFKKIQELKKHKNSTIVYVSHSMPMVQSICERVLWMDGGCIKMIGNTTKVIDAYLEAVDGDKEEEKPIRRDFKYATDDISIQKIDLVDKNALITHIFTPFDDLYLNIHFSTKEVLESPFFTIKIKWQSRAIINCSMLVDGARMGKILPGHHVLGLKIDRLTLMPGKYYIVAQAKHHIKSNATIPQKIAEFQIKSDPEDLNIQVENAPAVHEIRTKGPRKFVTYHWFYSNKAIGGLAQNKINLDDSV